MVLKNKDHTNHTNHTRKRPNNTNTELEMRTFNTDYIEPNVSFEHFILKEWDYFYRLIYDEIPLSFSNQNNKITNIENNNKHNINMNIIETMHIINNHKNSRDIN
jgi:hypothetical protein